MLNATLVFDLDGTLVDTAPDLVAATNHALSGLGLPLVPPETLRGAIGFGARRMIVDGLRQTGMVLPDPDLDRLLVRFLEHYEANIARESRPFEGAVDVLERLRAGGARLAVCTNKRLELGLDGLFVAVAGRDTFPVHKPHPDHLTGTVRLAGGDLRSTIFVGDSGIDIATARAAGVPVVGCAFGYSEVPIETLAPDAVVASYAELEPALAALCARAASPGASPAPAPHPIDPRTA